MRYPSIFAICALMATPVFADTVPRVVTDIAPVHGLVSRLMVGIGEPDLLVPSRMSPHDYSLRPSDAGKLASADLIVFIGHSLTPWFESRLGALSNTAAILELMDADGITLQETREDLIETGDHDHAHDHGDDDPHIWLSPSNAKAIMRATADEIILIAPEHRQTLEANFAAASDEIDALTVELAVLMAPIAGKPYVVFHDAYGYFESSFSLSSLGAVTLGDAQQPSAGRVREVRDQMVVAGAECIFREPQFQSNLVSSLSEDVDARVGVLDPIGGEAPLGAAHYDGLMRGMAMGLLECLDPAAYDAERAAQREAAEAAN